MGYRKIRPSRWQLVLRFWRWELAGGLSARPGDRQPFIPTPEQITAECEAIRAGWGTWRFSSHATRDAWMASQWTPQRIPPMAHGPSSSDGGME